MRHTNKPAWLLGAFALAIGLVGLPGGPAVAEGEVPIQLDTDDANTAAKVNALLDTVPPGGTARFEGMSQSFGAQPVVVPHTMTWVGTDLAGANLTAAVQVAPGATLTVEGPSFIIGGDGATGIVPTVLLGAGSGLVATGAEFRSVGSASQAPTSVILGQGANTVTLTGVTFADGDGPSSPESLINLADYDSMPAAVTLTNTTLPALNGHERGSILVNAPASSLALDGVTVANAITLATGAQVGVVGQSQLGGGLEVLAGAVENGAFTMENSTAQGAIKLAGDRTTVSLTGSSITSPSVAGLQVTGKHATVTLQDVAITAAGVPAVEVDGPGYSLTAKGATSLTSDEGEAAGIALRDYVEAGDEQDLDVSGHLALDGVEVLAGGPALRVLGRLDSTSSVTGSSLVGARGAVLGSAHLVWSFETLSMDRLFAGHLAIATSSLVANSTAGSADEPVAALAVVRADDAAKVTIDHSTLQVMGSSSGMQAGVPVWVAPSPLVKDLRLAIGHSTLSGPKTAVLRALSGYVNAGARSDSDVALGVDRTKLNLDENYWGPGLDNLNKAALNAMTATKYGGTYDDAKATPLLKGMAYTYFRTLSTQGLYSCTAAGVCSRVEDVQPEEVPPDPPAAGGQVVTKDSELVVPALGVAMPEKISTAQRVSVEVTAAAEGVAALGGTVTVKTTGTKRVSGHATMSGGKATVSLGKLKAGAYTVTVAYGGQTGVAGAGKIAGIVKVVRVASTVKLTAPKRVAKGKRAIVRVRVKAAGIQKLTGKVRLKVNGKKVGKNTALKGGKATLKLPAAAKTQKVTVTYLGGNKARPKTAKATIRLK
jgi:hypothetical protein